MRRENPWNDQLQMRALKRDRDGQQADPERQPMPVEDFGRVGCDAE